MLGALGVRMQLDWAKTDWFKQPSKQIKNSRFRMSVVLVGLSGRALLVHLADAERGGTGQQRGGLI